MSWYPEELRDPFTGAKEPSRAQPHTIIPPKVYTCHSASTVLLATQILQAQKMDGFLSLCFTFFTTNNNISHII